jgi:hypothetical protein
MKGYYEGATMITSLGMEDTWRGRERYIGHLFVELWVHGLKARDTSATCTWNGEIYGVGERGTSLEWRDLRRGRGRYIGHLFTRDT